MWQAFARVVVRGAPLIADGKLYIFDVKGRFQILSLKGDKAPDADDTFEYKFRRPDGLLNETNGTPIAVNGRDITRTPSRAALERVVWTW